MTQDQPSTLTQELSLLERKRRALIRVANITASLERLRLGYEAMLHLGQTDSPLPISAMQLFDQLGRKIRNLSDAEVKLRLGGLDKKLLHAQKVINQAIPQLVDPESSDKVLESFSQQIRDFQRLAHTNIALRVLIERRHIELPPLELNIPLDQIKSNISAVTTKERTCRSKVKKQIESMRVDFQRIIYSGLCSDSQKQVLQAMDAALIENIEHIQAGKSISDLPTPVEDLELNTVANQTSETPPLPHPKVTEQPRVSPAVSVDKTESQQDKQHPVGDKSSTSPSGKTPRKNLIKRFQIWLSTPWHVGWKDIDRDKDKDNENGSSS
ncbi:hypothetical protein [Hahella ganghwensis]|uniref:hypothetical protein n=1 Tax=Hahella ganghwensis TaxID=286420 RepID=UPI00037E2B4B|nr:hypothetical protein [Hahella ganghwensis]